MGAINKMVESVVDLPTGPKILPKLFELLDNEQSSVEEVADLIAFEPALTVRLLKFCNSAFFAGSEPVHSVPEAIGVVGFKALRPLMTAACSSTSFVLPAACGVDAEKIWRHSLLTAFGCKFVAEDTGENSDALFTAGLLHDIGRIVFAKAKGAEYGRLLAKAGMEKAQASTWENSTYGFSHAEVGAVLLRNWNFPDLISDCVRFHHLPQEATFPRAAACVYLGNALANSLDNPLWIYNLPPGELNAIKQLLGIDDQGMAAYAQKMTENMNFVNAML